MQRAPRLTELPPQAPAAWRPRSGAYRNCRSCLCRTRPSSGHRSHHPDSGCRKDTCECWKVPHQPFGECPVRGPPQIPSPAVVISGTSIASAPGFEPAPPVASVPPSCRQGQQEVGASSCQQCPYHVPENLRPSTALTSREPTAPASAPSEEAPAPGRATSVPTGSVVR